MIQLYAFFFTLESFDCLKWRYYREMTSPLLPFVDSYRSQTLTFLKPLARLLMKNVNSKHIALSVRNVLGPATKVQEKLAQLR